MHVANGVVKTILATENAEAMRGTEPKAFPQQNHPEHMKTHADFIATRMVQINP